MSCSVPGCTNYSEKTRKVVSTVSYHQLPLDDAQGTKAWLARIRRVDMPTLENFYVCSEHFSPECFEIDLRAQLTGQKCKRHLKDGTVPSVFPYAYGPKAKQPRLSTEKRLERQRHQQVST